MNIFFSYGHDQNKEIVMKIKADLEKIGHNVWIDQYKIKGGDDWRKAITQGIVESEMLMSFASEHSIRTPGVCLDELMIAVSVKGARVQSVLLEGNITPPANIGYRQYIDMSEWKSKKQQTDYEIWYQSKLQEIIDLVESDEVINYAKEIEYIKTKLKPNLNSIKKDRLQHEHYCGRLWLSKQVKSWINQEHDSKILLIDGAPGVGKSAFMAHEFIFNENVGAIIFCEWDQSGFNSLDAISRNLIFQLASKLSDYRYHLIQCLEKYYDEKEVQQNIFQTLFLQPLKSLIDGNRATITILIDGIDEIMDGQNDQGRRKNAFSELLQREMNQFPRWLRFVVTSRRDTTVLKPLEKADIIHIEEDSKENMEDVKQYLIHELKAYYDDQQIDWINQKCAGNFLYAKMICKALKNKIIDLKHFENIEAGDLNYIYRNFFDRTFTDYQEYEERYYLPLALLCACEEAIPYELFKKSLNLNQRQAQKYLKILNPYLSTNHESLRLYHKSMRDWLLSDESDDYQVELMDGIKAISEGCYQSYKEDINKMSDFEKQYLIPYLIQSKDIRIKEVLNDFEYAKLLMTQVELEMQRFQYELALKYAKMCQMICDHIQHKVFNQYVEFGDVYMKLAYIYFRQANYKNCFDCYDQAYYAYQNAKDELKQIDCLVMKANILRDGSRKDEALVCFEEMKKIKLYQTLKEVDINLYLKVRLNYAWVLNDKGRKDEAYEYSKTTREIACEAKSYIKERMYAQSGYLMCILEYGRANYQQAITYGIEALHILETLHGPFSVQICSVLNQIGAAYEKLESFDQAKAIYWRSYQIRYQYYGDHNMLTSISLRNYAKVLLAQKDERKYDEVEAILHKVFHIRKKLCVDGNAITRLAQSYMDLSDYYLIVNQCDQAIAYINDAIQYYQSVNANIELGTCYLIKGKIYYQIKEYRQAKTIFELGLTNRLKYYKEDHPHVKVMRKMVEKCDTELKKLG